MTANGAVPAAELVEVEPGRKLNRTTAAAYRAAKTAAARDGVALEIAPPAGGYRDLATQAAMREHPERFNLSAASTVALALPGHSTHGYGDRLDLVVGNANAWMLKHGAAYGFDREFGDADPNHWRHDGITVPPAPAAAPAATDLRTIIEGNSNMDFIAFKVAGKPTRARLVIGGRVREYDQATWNRLRDQVAFLRKRGTATIAALPAWDKLTVETQATADAFSDLLGAPRK